VAVHQKLVIREADVYDVDISHTQQGTTAKKTVDTRGTT